jgi:hypothetical protein
MRSTTRIAGLGSALLFVGSSALVACGSSGDAAPADRLDPGETLALPSKHGLTESHLTTDGAIAEGPNNAFLVAFDPGGTELVGASAFMPVHGHGTPKKIQIAPTESGYRVYDVAFPMAGLWNVTLDVKVGEDADTLEFNVDVP